MKSSQNTKNPRRSADIKRSSTKKRGGSSRESRAIPIITCTMWQVGRLSSASPLPTSALRQSAGGRSAIVGRSTASRNYNVGLSGTVTHSAGVRSIFAKAAVLERQKPRRVFAAHGEKMIWIIFAGGVYVGKNSTQTASVEFLRLRKNYARGRLQAFSNGNPAKRFSFENFFKNLFLKKFNGLFQRRPRLRT